MYNTKSSHLDMVENLFLDGLVKYGSGNDTQLILLDDYSPLQEETKTLIERIKGRLEKNFGDFQFIPNEQNLGFAKSYNKGLKYADGDVVAITNYDIRLTPDSLDSMIGCLDEGYSLVAPVTNNVGDAHQRISNFGGILNYSEGGMKKIDEFAKTRREEFASKPKIKEVKFPMGMFWVLPKEIIEDVGVFDERFKIAFWEDTDYAVRLRDKGYKSCIDSSSFLFHGEAGQDLTNWGTMLKYPFKISQDRLIFFKNGAKFIGKHGLLTFHDYLKETVLKK